MLLRLGQLIDGSWVISPKDPVAPSNVTSRPGNRFVVERGDMVVRLTEQYDADNACEECAYEANVFGSGFGVL